MHLEPDAQVPPSPARYRRHHEQEIDHRTQPGGGAGLGVTEDNWRDAIPRRPEFVQSETPFLVGRAVAAVAADANRMGKSGRVFNSFELATEYGLTDVDGRLPNVWIWIAENLPEVRFRKIDETFYGYVSPVRREK